MLTLAPNLAGESGLNLNQKAVGQALDRAMTAAGNSLGFHGLFALTPSQFAQGLTQLSGEVGTSGAPAGLLSMSQFLTLMLDPFAGTRGQEVGSGPALGFTQDRRTPAQAMEAYAAFRPFNKAPVATPLAYQERWTAWGAAYGSYSRADGDNFAGSNDRTVRTGHVAGGFERRISPDAVVGFALSGGCREFPLEQRPRQRPRRNLPGRRLRRLAVRQLLCVRIGGGFVLRRVERPRRDAAAREPTRRVL